MKVLQGGFTFAVEVCLCVCLCGECVCVCVVRGCVGAWVRGCVRACVHACVRACVFLTQKQNRKKGFGPVWVAVSLSIGNMWRPRFPSKTVPK